MTASTQRPAPGRRVLVAGIGNIFLGDDGFGPEVVRRLPADRLGSGVRVVDYGIRGMHLAYDLLDAWDALVLVDAVPDRGEAGALVVLEIGADDVPAAGLDAHAMDPGAVIAGLSALGGTLPPTVLVGCQAPECEERIGLSAAVEAAVDGAVDEVRALVSDLVTGRRPRRSSAGVG